MNDITARYIVSCNARSGRGCEIIFQIAILHSATEADPAFASSNFNLLPFTSRAFDIPAILEVGRGMGAGAAFCLPWTTRSRCCELPSVLGPGPAESCEADDYAQLANGPRELDLSMLSRRPARILERSTWPSGLRMQTQLGLRL